jgi:SAM-dependent methyltransferase
MSRNDVVIEAWNTVLFDKFVRFKHLLIAGLAGHSNELLSPNLFRHRDRVLDIGCGFGDSTIRIAQRLRALRHDVLHDAGAAMCNIRRALRPGGSFSQIVWRKREDNPWLHEAELRVREIVPVVSHEDTNQVHCGPGPFSMAGPDMVSSMMRGAGFIGVTFERFDTDICIARNLDDTVEFAMALGPAGEIIRLAGSDGERLKPQVVAALRETLSRYVRSDGVWAPSSTWFNTARNPR